MLEAWWILPVLFGTGVVAGWVDSIAGGGGLITIPVLLNFGLPPAVALGTNKLQATFGSGSATWHYGRAGLIPWRECAAGVVWTALGAAGGAVAVQWVRPDVLRMLIPVLLVGVALFFLFRPQLGDVDAQARLGRGAFYCLFGLGIGCYDGVFGPGTGTFWAFAFVLVLGFNLTKATAHTKLMNFTSNLVSLVVLAVGGKVWLLPGITMGLGQLLGAQIGSRMVVRRGAKFIRPIFIAVAVAVTARLVWQNLTGK